MRRRSRDRGTMEADEEEGDEGGVLSMAPEARHLYMMHGVCDSSFRECQELKSTFPYHHRRTWY